ncbi:hypothetical protein [Acinetobacter terrae]|uniref:Uncharacterized protein n=2 Tax=Acinetobacter terrae TaxID=2731247 RepID=A0ABX1V3W8_9GAMM|nr:hypothetical protein [Acinetobacter terrae]NNH88333.1 hypothetical protein [Acinetobacter terrae]
MKKLLIPVLIFVVLVLGYCVYQDSEMKKQKEVNQLILDAHQSLNIVDSNPNNFISNDDVEVVPAHSSNRFIAKSSEL